MLAVPIAMGIGYWCDGQLDSKPIGLGIGAVVGFAAMLLRVMRMRPPDSEIDNGSDKLDEQEPDPLERPEQPKDNGSNS